MSSRIFARLHDRSSSTRLWCNKYECICSFFRCEREAQLIPESKFFPKPLMVIGELLGCISIESRARASMWSSFILSTEKDKFCFFYCNSCAL